MDEGIGGPNPHMIRMKAGNGQVVDALMRGGSRAEGRNLDLSAIAGLEAVADAELVGSYPPLQICGPEGMIAGDCQRLTDNVGWPSSGWRLLLGGDLDEGFEAGADPGCGDL